MENIILTWILLVFVIVLNLLVFVMNILNNGIHNYDLFDAAIIFCALGLIVWLICGSGIIGDKTTHKPHKETTCECCECKQKITESQYQEAKDLIEKYEKQK